MVQLLLLLMMLLLPAHLHHHCPRTWKWRPQCCCYQRGRRMWTLHSYMCFCHCCCCRR